MRWRASRTFAAESTFTTADLIPYATAALDTASLSLGSLRYELSKLRANGLVENLEHWRGSSTARVRSAQRSTAPELAEKFQKDRADAIALLGGGDCLTPSLRGSIRSRAGASLSSPKRSTAATGAGCTLQPIATSARRAPAGQGRLRSPMTPPSTAIFAAGRQDRSTPVRTRTEFS